MPNQTVKDKRTQREYTPGQWVIVAERPNCQACRPEDCLTALYDARARDGRWGYFCGTHFLTLDCSLGAGRGQRLFLEDEVELIA